MRLYGIPIQKSVKFKVILKIINVNLSMLEYKSRILFLEYYVWILFHRVLNDSIERLYGIPIQKSVKFNGF